MKILFVTFGALSVSEGSFRSWAMLCALADAGHQISVIAAKTEITGHPNITVLTGEGGEVSTRKLRLTAVKCTASLKYDAVHAVDDAAPFCARLCRMRKVTLIYDALRCFTGPNGQPPAKSWKWFPDFFSGIEAKVLQKAGAVIAPTPALSRDLASVAPSCRIEQIEDVPAQPMYGCLESRTEPLDLKIGDCPRGVVACSVHHLSHSELRNLLMAARKVIDAVQEVHIVFRGADPQEARAMATSLDIQDSCCFLEHHETACFVSALDKAAASLFVPDAAERYIHPEIYTLLNAAAPVVAVHESQYDDLLSEANSIPVLRTADAMAEGVIRAVTEPLFSLGLSTAGQQLIADRYAVSSFKHKVRMLYHDALKSA